MLLSQPVVNLDQAIASHEKKVREGQINEDISPVLLSLTFESCTIEGCGCAKVTRL
jgi:hypothetical protein